MMIKEMRSEDKPRERFAKAPDTASMVDLVAFQKKLGGGLFGGEGFIMQRLSGNGTAFVDMAVKGNGAVTDAYYKVAGQNSLDNVLTLNGDVNIITPKSRERGFLALGAFGGTVNVNVKTEMRNTVISPVQSV